MKPITNSLTVNFRGADEPGYQLRLEEDKDRATPVRTFHTAPYYVTAEHLRYVRLYMGPGVEAVPQAVTGQISHVGESVENDVRELLMFTPDTEIGNIPSWAVNVRVASYGKAYLPDGNIAHGVTYRYDSMKHGVVPSTPVHGVAVVTYDAPYSLFLYHFDGFCPTHPPARFDVSGNPIEDPPERHFMEGLIYAMDVSLGVSSSLSMTPPQCKWEVLSSLRETEEDRKVPSLKLEIDPEYPPKFVGYGKSLRCECVVRVFPAGVASQILITEGSYTQERSPSYKQVIEDLLFNNESSKTLSYTPATVVELWPIKLYGTSSSSLTNHSVEHTRFLGAGETVVDVDYSEDERTYSNARPRVTEKNEIVAVGSFRMPVKVLAAVKATYAASYDRVRYVFRYDPSNREFLEGMMLAIAPDGRTGHIDLKPPSMKSRNKRFNS